MATKSGSIKSTSINGVKLYTLSSQRSSATLLDPKKKRALRKDKDYLQRVDLLQDLRFETAASKIKATPDGEYVIASGIYPPQVKVFELKELSQKFERHFISEIINFEILADDYSKLAFLCSDRSVALHAKYGSHYSLRIPRMGRDIAYDRWSCDLLCAASSPDLYRINLEQGRFLQSLTSQSPGINVVARSAIHGLVACGCEDGAIECFDMRQKSSVGRISTLASTNDIDQEVTALKFDDNQGYLLAVGTSTSKIPTYDLRMSDPVRMKDHFYGEAISSIKWHQTLNSTEPKLITADSHVVRIWDPNTGDDVAQVESSGSTINDVCIFRNSGLMLLALDNGQVPAHFLPALGPAPKWCSYLENLTDEMEENAETVIYENYKFLTKEDLERLNLTNLIGTNLLKAYMHGFFVDYGLYKKAKNLAEPFNLEEINTRKRQQEEEAKRQDRITLIKKLPKVNHSLAARLHEKEEMENYERENADDTIAKKKKKNEGLTTNILKDDRFKLMFHNPRRCSGLGLVWGLLILMSIFSLALAGTDPHSSRPKNFLSSNDPSTNHRSRTIWIAVGITAGIIFIIVIVSLLVWLIRFRGRHDGAEQAAAAELELGALPATGQQSTHTDGLDLMTIRALPIATYPPPPRQLDGTPEPFCPICWDEFAMGGEVRVLPCSHYFHATCIEEALLRKDSCPMCTQSVAMDTA